MGARIIAPEGADIEEKCKLENDSRVLGYFDYRTTIYPVQSAGEQSAALRARIQIRSVGKCCALQHSWLCRVCAAYGKQSDEYRLETGGRNPGEVP